MTTGNILQNSPDIKLSAVDVHEPQELAAYIIRCAWYYKN